MTDLFQASEQLAIFNKNNVRWGSETYATEAEAMAELKSFFKGQKVDLASFSIKPVPPPWQPSDWPQERRDEACRIVRVLATTHYHDWRTKRELHQSLASFAETTHQHGS